MPDTDQCGAMCLHIGPSGLKCPEGEPLYNSDLPGPKDVPNQSCEDWCKDQQGKADDDVPVQPRLRARGIHTGISSGV